MTIGLIILAIIVVIGLAYVGMYNTLKRLSIATQSAWSDIDVQLKRRNDLIPNLVNTVKGVAKYESGVLENVTKLRGAIGKELESSAPNRKHLSQLNAKMDAGLHQIVAVSENYPELTASESYLNLQSQLTDTEDKIASARRFYNIAVNDLNSKIATVPYNVIASSHNIKNAEFYDAELSKAQREPVKVEF